MSGGLRAVFLDRDGVLNRVVLKAGRPYPPARLAELEILRGVPGALRALKAAGFLLVVVTNQPDVARGIQRREVVEEINAALRAALPLDDVLVCYHDDADDCPCRKPRPGLLVEAATRHGIDVASSFMIGDRWKDVEAGRRAGCGTILMRCDYFEPAPEGSSAPDFIVSSLADAVRWMQRPQQRTGKGK